MRCTVSSDEMTFGRRPTCPHSMVWDNAVILSDQLATTSSNPDGMLSNIEFAILCLFGKEYTYSVSFSLPYKMDCLCSVA